MQLQHLFSVKIAIFTLMVLCLSGCNQDDIPLDKNSPKDNLIAASLVNSKGEKITTTSDIKLGLVTEDEDDDISYGIGFMAINSPCILKDGYLYPDLSAIYVPEERSFVTLYAYAPYVPDDILIIYPPNKPPFTTISIKYDAELDQRTNGTASSDLMWGRSKFMGPNTNSQITLQRKCCKIKFKLSSELNKDLSDAEVTILNVSCSGIMSLLSGIYHGSTAEDYKNNITAFRLDDGTFEAIIPPQTIGQAAHFIKVRTDNIDYIFENKQNTNLIEGTEYEYILNVKDAGTLPFKALISYNGSELPNSLSVGALGETKEISMKEIPNAGNNVSYTRLAIRNADGGSCWAKIKNFDITGRSDVIYDGIRLTNMTIEENIGAARSMTLEFYNVNMPKFVHKRVTINQASAVNYLNLSSEVLDIDKWGNVYDFPEKLKVTSNMNWELKSIPDWITVSGYTPGDLNQTLLLKISPNATSSTRSAELQFTVDGAIKKRCVVTQSTKENTSFTLKYELNLDYSTVEDKFYVNQPGIGNYYASLIIIFAKFEPNSDAAAEIDTNNYYGFVTDYNSGTANNLVVTDFKSDYFIYKGYNGSATTIYSINSNILGPKNAGSQNIFRQIIFNLPIPPDVKRNQKVKYYVTIKNITGTQEHGPANVSYYIVNQ